MKMTKKKKAPAPKKKKDGDSRAVQSFEEIGTKLRLKLTFMKPLIPRKPKVTISDLLGPKMDEKQQPSRPATAANQRVRDQFQATLAVISKQVLAESARQTKIYETMGAGRKQPVDQANMILKELRQSGIYSKFKNQLKPYVVDLARTTFFRKMPGELTGDDDDGSPDKAKLVNELFCLLKATISRNLNGPESENQRTDPFHARQIERDRSWNDDHVATNMLLNACVAEMAGDIDLADIHFQNRMHHVTQSADTSAPDFRPALAKYWFEYGAFTLRQGDMDKAEYCFKQSLSHDPNCYPSCIAYGALLLEEDALDEATLHIQNGLSNNPDSIISLLMKALLHDVAEEDEESWQAYGAAAARLESGHEDSADIEALLGKRGLSLASSGMCSLGLTDRWENGKLHSEQILESTYFVLARLLMGLNLPSLAYRVLTVKRSKTPGNIGQSTSLSAEDQSNATEDITEDQPERLKHCRLLLLSELFTSLQKPDHAQTFLSAASAALSGKKLSPFASIHYSAIQGRVAFAAGDKAKALKFFKNYFATVKTGKLAVVLDPLVCFTLCKLLTEANQFKECLAVAEKMCSDSLHSTSSAAWLLCGQTALRSNKYSQAEQALSRASLLDDKNPKTWGLISLLCLRRRTKTDSAYSVTDQAEGEEQLYIPELVDDVDVVEAAQAFLVAVQLNIKDSEVLGQLGKEFWEVGHLKEASMALRRCLLSENNDELHDLLQRVIEASDRDEASL